ncbi:hypothetical protein HY772_07950, partial [Candidatus Woesearchaeota archaeon]|nr:hypothetical protein [Candidatus Woesearchaeota archaeon]
RPQPASVPTPPAPSVPPVHIPPAQVPVPPASTVSPTAVPPPVPPESDPRPPKKKALLRPAESLTAGFTQTRADYHDGDDVVSMKDSALEAAVKFQIRKPQWSAFLRGRITGSATLSGHINYQNKTIGEYRRFKGAGDITAAIPFGKGNTVEFGPYVSQTTRYVKFNLGEVQREEETVNYGLLLRGNFEGVDLGDLHVDLRVMFGFGWQNESAKSSDITTEFATLDSFLGVPIIVDPAEINSTAKNCELENSEHLEDHRCYLFSMMPYVGSRGYVARTGEAFDHDQRTVDFTRSFFGFDVDVRLYGPLLWLINFQYSEETYPTGKNGPSHSVQENRVMTGPRVQF